jgi:hypothetical protein
VSMTVAWKMGLFAPPVPARAGALGAGAETTEDAGGAR